jgi:CubicO group peptidase (beta-lactamase class C family)
VTQALRPASMRAQRLQLAHAQQALRSSHALVHRRSPCVRTNAITARPGWNTSTLQAVALLDARDQRQRLGVQLAGVQRGQRRWAGRGGRSGR